QLIWPMDLSHSLPWSTKRARATSFCSTPMKRVLIRYYFDYERARIWRSGALETSRHDQSVQQPCQEFGGATWAGSALRRVAPDQTEVRANSYAVGRSCRRPERAPRVASSGCDPYRSSRFCAPEAPRPGAG